MDQIILTIIDHYNASSIDMKLEDSPVLTVGRRLFVSMPNLQVWSRNIALLPTSSWGLVRLVMRMVMTVRKWGWPFCAKLPMNTSGIWVETKDLSFSLPQRKGETTFGKVSENLRITVENLRKNKNFYTSEILASHSINERGAPLFWGRVTPGQMSKT